jgi:hypothetical protein
MFFLIYINFLTIIDWIPDQVATANRNSDFPSYMLLNCKAERMHAIGGSLDYDVSPDGHSITLQVFPVKPGRRGALKRMHGMGTITLLRPTR